MLKAWLKKNWRTVLQIIAWVLLFISGGTGVTTITDEVQALKVQVESLRAANETLQRALDLVNMQLDDAQQQLRFLMDCLTKPLPWPGGHLCPKPRGTSSTKEEG